MVLDDGLIFENCLIKNGKKTLENIPVFKEELKPLEDIKFDEVIDNDDSNNNENIVFDLNNNNNLEEVTKSQETIIENNLEELESFDIDMSETEQLRPEEKDENISLDLEIEELKEDIEENTDELREVNNLDISLENNLETMQLKKPNQVYFELYKEARNKAKIAKKNALLAYLEAKNIKKTYLIENLNDSDSDIDAEIDDVSESELEGL